MPLRVDPVRIVRVEESRNLPLRLLGQTSGVLRIAGDSDSGQVQSTCTKSALHPILAEGRRVSTERIDIKEGLLWRLYWDEELSLRAIGRRLGVSPACVLRNMRLYDIPRRSARDTAGGVACLTVPMSELARLYHQEKLPLRIIGERLGCAGETVRMYLVRALIPRRRYGWRQHRTSALRCPRCGLLVQEPGLCEICQEEEMVEGEKLTMEKVSA